MKALPFDTETTGIPLWNEPSDDPRQPHIVQLAAMLVDTGTREVAWSFDVIVRPNGWVIPPEMSAIHGITQERAMDEGIEEPQAVGMMLDMWRQCDFRVAHNEPFDSRIVRIALKRYPELARFDQQAWKDGERQCTQRMATKALQIGKTANLREAYRILTGTELEGAHTALADAKACMAVYFALKDREYAAAAPLYPATTQEAPAP